MQDGEVDEQEMQQQMDNEDEDEPMAAGDNVIMGGEDQQMVKQNVADDAGDALA